MICGLQITSRCPHPKTKQREIDRKMTIGLYLLRAIQCGLHVADLKALSIGLIHDLFIESENDHYDYPYIATQEDIDRL